MKRQLQGIAVLLLSGLLMEGFHCVGWVYVGDLSLCWQHIFMLTGIAGCVMVFLPEKRK
ncbi:MAG: hypothetical protein ACI4V1_06085 [Eubacteriales bacterium]